MKEYRVNIGGGKFAKYPGASREEAESLAEKDGHVVWPAAQNDVLLDAAETVGDVACSINYLLTDLCAVLGPLPWTEKLDRWAAELFKAARVIRRTADPEKFK